eukprot:3582693-Rhodomonas_salina.1
MIGFHGIKTKQNKTKVTKERQVEARAFDDVLIDLHNPALKSARAGVPECDYPDTVGPGYPGYPVFSSGRNNGVDAVNVPGYAGTRNCFWYNYPSRPGTMYMKEKPCVVIKRRRRVFW